MVQRFPVGPSIGQVRGVLKVLNENGGTMSIAQLADEINENIDNLLPLLDACELLDTIKVKGGMISVKEEGRKFDAKRFVENARSRLREIEPFRTVIAALSEHELATPELTEKIRKKGISFHADKITNEEIFKSLMLSWGVRAGIVRYNSERDTWTAQPSR
ncbi:MAG: AAA-associated domain-containing protein [Candidatus Micrarchaeaceae archaeon]